MSKDTELRKALLQTTGSGQYLAPEDLEPVLVEYLKKISPLMGLVDVGRANGMSHQVNVRTAIPSAWFEGEVTAGTAAASTYTRNSVGLKIMRAWGGVSGFQRAASSKFIDALEAEQTGSIEAMADLLEYSLLWGNDADSYQTSGLDTYVSEDVSGTNITNNSTMTTVTLSNLDTALDVAEGYRGVQRDKKVFVMSPSMISKVSALQTLVQRNVQQVEFEGGFRMNTYRGVPLVPSSFVQPASTTTSPTVTATAAAGGSLADDEYFYRISSVTMYGEQLVGGEDSATTATTNNTVTLTWTADSNAKLYKVWRGTATGVANMTLLTTIAAKTYNSSGAVSASVATFSDDGSYTADSNITPLTTSGEVIFLANLDPRRGMTFKSLLSELGEPVDNLIRYVELARTKSAYEFIMETFGAIQIPWSKLHYTIRGVKPS